MVHSTSADLQFYEFFFNIILNFNPFMMFPRQSHTWMLCTSACLCVFTSSDICPVCDLCLSNSLLSDVFCLSSCSTLRARCTLFDSHTNTNTVIEIPKHDNTNKFILVCCFSYSVCGHNCWNQFCFLAAQVWFKSKTLCGMSCTPHTKTSNKW